MRLSTEALARACARRPGRTIAAWLVAVLLAAAAAVMLLGDALTSDDAYTGQPESKRADALLEATFPPDEREFDADEVVVLQGRSVDDPAFRARVNGLARDLRGLDGGRAVAETKHGDRSLISRDHRTALLLLELGPTGEDEIDAIAERVTAAGAAMTGEASVDADTERVAEQDLKKGEMLGMGLALVVLLIVFGAVVAAVVPIVVAMTSIVAALGLAALIGQGATMHLFALNMLGMMGLAVGVDYSLFVVSRYREERRAGRERDDAIAAAGATASRAVVFSGLTVVIALVGLFLVPQTIFRSLAGGAILAVVVSVVAALTLLPALLRLLGDHIDALRLPVPRRRRPRRGGIAERVARRPVASLLASGAILAALAAASLGLETGSAGVSTMPDAFATKRAFEIVEREFGTQRDSAAHVAIRGDLAAPESRRAVRRLRASIRRDGAYGRPTYEERAGGTKVGSTDVAHLAVPLSGDPVGEDAIAAVHRLRERHIPQAFAGAPLEGLVAGRTAGELDFHALADRYRPIVVGLVLGLSFVLLAVAFRSLVVPALAIAVNGLSVAAAFGVLVLVFQEGAGEAIGLQRVEAIESWLPLFLFTVLFGLSMDYHVMLLSRIRERFVATGDAREAVGFGVRATARIIVGAALIMVAVFAGFGAGDLAPFQQMGVGLGAAVLLDATLVRTVLVPAAMHLLGRFSWWVPRPMRPWQVARMQARYERR